MSDRILIVGATRSHAVLVYAHVIASALGAAVLAAYIWRKVSLEAPGRVAWTVRVSLAAVLAAAIGATFQWAVRDTRWRQAYRIVNPTVVAVSMNIRFNHHLFSHRALDGISSSIDFRLHTLDDHAP